MIKLITYKEENGRIVGQFSCPSNVIHSQHMAGEDYLEASANIRLDYVNVETRQVTPRPTLLTTFSKAEIAADTTDVTTLTDLPDPCTITYMGPGINITQEVTGGTAEFTTDTPGTHTVKVEAFPYLDWEGTFDAV